MIDRILTYGDYSIIIVLYYQFKTPINFFYVEKVWTSYHQRKNSTLIIAL